MSDIVPVILIAWMIVLAAPWIAALAWRASKRLPLKSPDHRRDMLMAASMSGNGRDVACDRCYQALTEKSIFSVDEDGVALCAPCAASLRVQTLTPAQEPGNDAAR